MITRLVTDENQNVKKRTDYLPFGEELSAGVNGRPVIYNGSSPAQKFTSKERENGKPKRGWIISWQDTTHRRRGGLRAPMELKTTVPACIFGVLFVDVPVVIKYSVAEKEGKQTPANISIRIAEIHDCDWCDQPLSYQIK